MYKYLQLQNFRSYKDYSLELSPGVNIIVGPNASGKTNLLEALYVVSTGKSFRVKDENLINFNSDWARLDSRHKNTERTVKISRINGRLNKDLVIDGVSNVKIQKEKIIPVTLFEPQDLKLFSDPPETRRNYLDAIIEQADITYYQIRSKYKKVLFQRNKYLKNSKHVSTTKDDLFVWDLQLSNLGALIFKQRNQMIKQINETTNETYSRISQKKSNLKLVYKPSISAKDYSSAMLKLLSDNLTTDSTRGFTSVGPHRDDFDVYLNDKDADISASRGETRTIVLTLKLIELVILENLTNMKPLLLLDDVFSELDGARRQALTKHLKNYQTIITTTDADAVVGHFMSDYKVVPL